MFPSSVEPETYLIGGISGRAARVRPFEDPPELERFETGLAARVSGLATVVVDGVQEYWVSDADGIMAWSDVPSGEWFRTRLTLPTRHDTCPIPGGACELRPVDRTLRALTRHQLGDAELDVFMFDECVGVFVRNRATGCQSPIPSETGDTVFIEGVLPAGEGRFLLGTSDGEVFELELP
jgi:hypothetical protein